jgi:hypothetical protein
MVGEESKPWDARLLERIQRGSGEAGSGRRMTPKQRIFYGVFWIMWVSISVSTNGRQVRWWLIVVIVVAGSGVQYGGYLWEERRRKGQTSKH